MNKTFKVIVGIDVSKDKLDYCIIKDPGAPSEFGIIPNTRAGVLKLIRMVKRITAAGKEVLYCFENTGVYSVPLCCIMETEKMNYWVEDGLQIKRSKGITRGKSDKNDARDIALYALSHTHRYTPSVLPEESIMELRLLLAEREKLIGAIRVFTSTKESKGFMPDHLLKRTLAENKRTIVLLKKQLTD